LLFGVIMVHFTVIADKHRPVCRDAEGHSIKKEYAFEVSYDMSL